MPSSIGGHTISVNRYYGFRPYGESLSLCSRKRESNQRESAPGIRVWLRQQVARISMTGKRFAASSLDIRTVEKLKGPE